MSARGGARRKPGGAASAVVALAGVDWNHALPFAFHPLDQVALGMVGDLPAMKAHARSGSTNSTIIGLLAAGMLVERGELFTALEMAKIASGDPDPGSSRIARKALADPSAWYQMSGPVELPLVLPWDRQLALVLCSRVCLVLGRLDEAADHASRLRSDAVGLAVRAEAVVAARRLDEARRLIPAPPNITDDLSGYLALARGLAIREAGDPSAAAAEIDRVVHEPKLAESLRVEALVERAVCYVYAGRLLEARRDHSLLLQRAPTNERVTRIGARLDELAQ